MLSHAKSCSAKSLYVIVLGTIFVLISFPDLAVNLSQCVGIPIFGLQFTMPHMASNGLKKFASHDYIMVFVSMTWVMRVTGGHGRLQNLLCFLCLRSQPSHQTIQTLPSHKKGNNFTIRTEFYNCVFFISHHSTSSTVSLCNIPCTIHIWSSLLGA